MYTKFGVPINSYRLKNRLLREGVLERKCRSCEGTKWMGKLIPLELEHKNGNSEDNQLENLELLCPNCHAFTETYRGRNKKKVTRLASSRTLGHDRVLIYA
jgi:5-methylcytosine-specific restriction endonuclease McrA